MRRLLVCLDNSSRAPHILATGLEAARRFDAEVRLLRVVGIPPTVDEELVVHSGSPLLDDLTREATSELEALAREQPRIRREDLVVRVGAPWDTICREAGIQDVDLVVIGSHGFRGFDHVLGTTAARVVNHCERSVLVVRPNLHSGKRET